MDDFVRPDAFILQVDKNTRSARTDSLGVIDELREHWEKSATPEQIEKYRRISQLAHFKRVEKDSNSIQPFDDYFERMVLGGYKPRLYTDESEANDLRYDLKSISSMEAFVRNVSINAQIMQLKFAARDLDRDLRDFHLTGFDARSAVEFKPTISTNDSKNTGPHNDNIVSIDKNVTKVSF